MSSQHADSCWLQGRRKLARAQQRGSEQRKPVAVGAIVSNHISYTDVLVSKCTLGCSLPLACCRGGAVRLMTVEAQCNVTPILRAQMRVIAFCRQLAPTSPHPQARKQLHW